MRAVCSCGEAFFVAAEMERRAIRFYERAEMLFSEGEVSGRIKSILQDERKHLARFIAFGAQTPFDAENGALLSAESASLIFAGGMTEAVRNGAFASEKALLTYAIRQEQNAINAYERFAASFDALDEQKQAFIQIANEEKRHLQDLNAALSSAKE